MTSESGMRVTVAVALLFGLSLIMSGCADPEERRDVGSSDGYAVGYNTECRIRATMVEGDFKNAEYAQAYAEGEIEGAEACKADRAKRGDGGAE